MGLGANLGISVMSQPRVRVQTGVLTYMTPTSSLFCQNKHGLGISDRPETVRKSYS